MCQYDEGMLFIYAFTVLHLKTVLNALHPVRASWYNIGLEFGIPHTELDTFKQKYLDPSDLLRETLKYWFQTAINPHPSWEAVVVALTSRIVNKWFVAEQLELKYCTPEQNKTGEPYPTMQGGEG